MFAKLKLTKNQVASNWRLQLDIKSNFYQLKIIKRHSKVEGHVSAKLKLTKNQVASNWRPQLGIKSNFHQLKIIKRHSKVEGHVSANIGKFFWVQICAVLQHKNLCRSANLVLRAEEKILKFLRRFLHIKKFAQKF